jgi:hypothetical protein
MLVLSIAAGLWIAWTVGRSDAPPAAIGEVIDNHRAGVVAVATCGDTFASAVPRLNAMERDYGNVVALIAGDPEACARRLNLKMKTARATEQHGAKERLYVLDGQGRVAWQGHLGHDTVTARRELARLVPKRGKSDE